MHPVQAVSRKRGIKLWILPLTALLLAAAVVAPPLISLKGLHHRVAESISQAVGRPVRMSSIKMRLLPRPGFEISDFVVDEDPAFGVEPILRSSQVIASVRLLPLWRGRLEIARIAFDEPSVNLVRNREGRWNFDALLSQAAQIPKAPTGQAHPRGLPRFPYIDASNARVNFKSGDEKLPFSFLDADLAVWLENPGEWRIQFAAQPVRTDLSLDLANTGLFRLEGSLRHAAKLTQMPMQLHAEWNGAPLGQLSRILTGSDANWRGQLDATAEITGSLDHAALKLTASGQGIHRAEFDRREPLDLNVICQATFNRDDRLFDAITCLSPTGDGHLLLTGSIHAVLAKPDPALSLELNNVPVAAAFDGIRLFRAGFGTAVVATGAIDGSFTYASAGAGGAQSGHPQVHGQATVNHLTIAGPALQKPLALPALHFSMNAAPRERPRRGRASKTPAPASEQPPLLLEPFAIGTSASSPADSAPTTAARLPTSMTVGATFDRNGFNVHLGGQSHVGELIALGKEFGLAQSSARRLREPGDGRSRPDHPWSLDAAGHRLRPNSVAPAAFAMARCGFTMPSLPAPSSPSRCAFQPHKRPSPVIRSIATGPASALSYGPVRADGHTKLPGVLYVAGRMRPSFQPLHIASLDAATAQVALLGAQRHGEIARVAGPPPQS